MSSIIDIVNDDDFMTRLNYIPCPRTPVLTALEVAIKQTTQAQDALNELDDYNILGKRDRFLASEHIDETLVILKDALEKYKRATKAIFIKAIIKERSTRKLQEHNASSD